MPISEEMLACINLCLDCHKMCLATAMQYSLEIGGRHVEPGHFRLMMACAEICQTTANFMLMGSHLHSRICAICADVCDSCAHSCEAVGNADECGQVCRRCADMCREISAC